MTIRIFYDGPLVDGANPADDNSALAQIMKELSAVRDGAQSPASREAILKLLQGEMV